MVVVDGEGVPLACHRASASPAEVTLLEPTLDNIDVRPADDEADPPGPCRPAAFTAMVTQAGFVRAAAEPMLGGLVTIHSGWRI